MGKEILDYSAQLLPIWAVQRNINPTSTWHFMHCLIYESKEGRWRKKCGLCQQLLTLVLVFLFRCESQECLVTFYECIRQDRGHFRLFFAINTKLTHLCWISFLLEPCRNYGSIGETTLSHTFSDEILKFSY